jgi:hydroxyacylglutathione hydrolase
VLVERSMHPAYLSNAYLLADEEGGTAVFVDSGAPLEPLLAAADRWHVRPQAVLRTHSHHDHVEHEDELVARYGIEVATQSLDAGGLRVEALATPGHSADGVSFVVNGDLCFSGDTLFKDAVGGTRDDFEGVRRSVMDVLMALPPETRVLPGHTDETTIGREREENPFVRVWRGVDAEGTDRCRVGGEEATIVVWSPDYDGKGKAWVRFADGRNAIVGGSGVERL